MSSSWLRIAVFTAVAVAPGVAHAHRIWIEQDAAGAKVYFGEFGENLREVSPGLLDKFVKTSALHFSSKGEKPVAVTKTATAFVLDTRAGKGETLVAQESEYPVFEKKDGEKVVRTAWTPAARIVSDFSAQDAKLTLDIVPTGKVNPDGSVELQVSYQKLPLPEAEVTIVAASGWGRELETDKDGRLSVVLPWQGTYVVEAKHTDKTPASRKVSKGATASDEAYDVASYVTTLSFTTVKGLASPPAPPAAKPNH